MHVVPEHVQREYFTLIDRKLTDLHRFGIGHVVPGNVQRQCFILMDQIGSIYTCFKLRANLRIFLRTLWEPLCYDGIKLQQLYCTQTTYSMYTKMYNVRISIRSTKKFPN